MRPPYHSTSSFFSSSCWSHSDPFLVKLCLPLLVALKSLAVSSSLASSLEGGPCSRKEVGAVGAAFAVDPFSCVHGGVTEVPVGVVTELPGRQQKVDDEIDVTNNITMRLKRTSLVTSTSA